MLINTQKTKLMQFGPANSRWISSLNINGNEIAIVTSFKLLGLTITDDLKWNQHVDSVCKRAYRLIYLIVRVKQFNNNRHTLLTIYKLFIRSIISYGFPAFCNITPTLRDKLVKIERRFSTIAEVTVDTNLLTFCNKLCINMYHKTLKVNEHPLRSLFLISNSGRDTRANSRGNNLLLPYGNSTRSRNHFIKFCYTNL